MALPDENESSEKMQPMPITNLLGTNEESAGIGNLDMQMPTNDFRPEQLEAGFVPLQPCSPQQTPHPSANCL